jgi:hypothetical protein
MVRFVMPSQVVWQYPQESARVARLGALANAVLSVMSMQAGSLAVGVGKERDRLQASLLMIGYLKEAVEAFNSGNNRGLVLEGIAAGYPLPKPLDELWEPFTKGRDSFYERLGIAIRNTKAFHVDEDRFIKWAKELQAPTVTLWRKDSQAPLDWVFTASAQIQSFMGTTLDQESVTILRTGAMMSFLVEAMAWGLVARIGADPRRCYSEMALREVTIDYQFRDGRPPLTEAIRLVADVSGGLDSFVEAIREHATLVFGGSLVGAGQFEPGEVILSSPRGSAKARLGAQIATPSLAGPRFVLLRMGDMASWGRHWVSIAMTYADRVRTGQVTPQETTDFIDDLRADLAYWEDRKREVDVLSAELRDEDKGSDPSVG